MRFDIRGGMMPAVRLLIIDVSDAPLIFHCGTEQQAVKTSTTLYGESLRKIYIFKFRREIAMKILSTVTMVVALLSPLLTRFEPF